MTAAPAPSLADTIAALERYAARDPEAPDPWVGMGGGDVRVGENGKRMMTMPFPIYSPEVDRIWAAFRAAGYKGDPDYGTWANSRDIAAITPAVIADMPAGDLRSFLTWCERGERFSDGYWQDLLRNGTFLAIARRLAALANR